MATFSVNLASIQKKFPKGMQVPPLLEAFAPWVAKMLDGSLGNFEVMAGGKYVDGALSAEANKKIAAATGIFMSFGEGSQLALWNHDDDAPPAVVLIESEGQHRTVAPSLEAFFEAWSKQKTETELDGKYLDDGPPQRHAELAAWLRTQKVNVEKRKAPHFGKWIEKLSKVDAPPSANGLPAPPKDMATRAIAALGKPASDAALSSLLGELGIDLKSYKTADAQRALYAPSRGYALSFEKKVLKSVLFANKGYTSWSNGTGREETFAAYPHAVINGANVTDTLKNVKAKIGTVDDENPDAGLYYFKVSAPSGAAGLIRCATPDSGGDVPVGAVLAISVGVR